MKKMAVRSSHSLLPFLLPLCEWRLVCRLRQGYPTVMKMRQVSYSPHASVRLKLKQDDTSPDTQGLVTKYYYNRNPRSPELLGIAEKPRGFATWHRRVDYYHRLMLEISERHISAYVNHNNGTKVVEASTKEFCIAKHLHKSSDVAATFNIGRVIAARCKEAGLLRVMWEHKWNRNHEKVIAFIKGIKFEGLVLNEPKVRRKLPEPGTLPGC